MGYNMIYLYNYLKLAFRNETSQFSLCGHCNGVSKGEPVAHA